MYAAEIARRLGVSKQRTHKIADTPDVRAARRATLASAPDRLPGRVTVDVV
jgi:hypothetical protein